MNKIILIFVFAVVLILANACDQKNSKQVTQTDKTENIRSYLSVDEVFSKGDSLANKTVYVEGIIEHVCKNTWKRFKIIDETGKHELKIELSDKTPSIDASIMGKKAKIIGKLIPIQMDEKIVQQWEKKMKENHKGEENTEHYKEELATIQNIHNQITSGEIPYYTMYSVKTESYELE
ncbi:MAG: hypothetical protein EOL95_05155 [Bacteroidia bacterium]|nr:hypothetical protein [Bacteroidia bacterium]